MTSPRIDLSRLTLAERLALLEELWDSLASDADVAPVSPELTAELERRLADTAEHPDVGSPWAEVRARIEQRGRG
jgi:putative addiction module component (TIGR02574 family)